MIKTISGALLAEMFISGAAAIENERVSINELNVFPVPDGDTGINMSLTMNTAVADLKKIGALPAGKVAEITAGGLLRGARGNSGVILSLLFRGFSKKLKDRDEISGYDFALALQEGVDMAYRAVMKPTEGTILTVSRVAAARGVEFGAKTPDFEKVFSVIIDAAEAALELTVEQNPVLKKAGVIDAGGKGLCVIFSGMKAALLGNPVTVASQNTDAPTAQKANFAEYSSDDILFAYCTEFIILRNASVKKDPAKLNALLGSLGDSLVFVDDEQLIKVHVHTNNPGKALEEALTYGALSSIKIENMREQHTEVVINSAAESEKPVIAEPKTRYGFVAVCSGKGLIAAMHDLGITNIVEGGQTMNPSTEDILRAVNATPSEIVFIMPNNKNIIMAAEQVIPLTPKTVVVLPTVSVPQGIAAMFAFDPEADFETNREAMLSAFGNVSTGQITYAARDSGFDGADISTGDRMALYNGKLLFTHKDGVQVLRRLAEEISKRSPSFVTVFYGEGVMKEDAQEASAIFEELCPSAEIVLVDGGQPVYYYLVSAE